MVTRLSVIATRTGDGGSTGLGDGTRCDKDALRVVALGEVDELNSTIGLLRTEPLPDAIQADLSAIQHALFDVGAELSIPGHEALAEAQRVHLDEALLRYNTDLPPLREFILPGGTRSAALAHVARTVCRRAERSIVALGRQEPVTALARQYLNRLSDLFFVLARVLNRHEGRSDVLWNNPRAR